MRWIAGAYFVHTDRFISTGNMVDTATACSPCTRSRGSAGNNPSATFLADSQDNDAWAVFGDVTFELSDKFELDAAVRYDEDKRENTTETPTAFLPDPSASRAKCARKPGARPSPRSRCATSPARTSRSSAAGAAASAAVDSTRPAWARWPMPTASPASTTCSKPKWPTPGKSGFKGQFLDRRLNIGVSVFDTESTNGYFFVFLAANSTQNLGNLDADYQGAEFEISAKVTDNLELFGSYGFTDSEITDMEDPSVIGNQAPLVSDVTYNLGAQWRQPLGDSLRPRAARRLPARRQRPGGSRTM